MKDFKKVVLALKEKAQPQYSLGNSTVYSFLGSIDNKIAIKILECLLIKGFNAQLDGLKKKYKIGKLSLNEAKTEILKVKPHLLETINEYSLRKSDSSCMEIYHQDLPDSSTLKKEKGIDINKVSRNVKGLDKTIDLLTTQSLKMIELYAMKIVRTGGFSIGENVPNREVEMLYQNLTKPGEEQIKGDFSDFESVLRGKGDNKHRIKVLSQGVLLKIVKELQKLGWHKPQGASYWKYVADNFEEFKQIRWQGENLRKNFGHIKSTNKSVAVEIAFGGLTPYKNINN
jgi:hypothetical protein